jgi:GT2 family glycosyltransferase
MQRMFSIASVTVAYNGKHLLSRHLDALLNQTVPLTEVIVVNNASVDGTAEFVSEHYPSVTVIDLRSNVGVGGGYAAGLEYAIRQKAYDWVWLFDQDSIPAPDALQHLVDALEHLAGANPQTAVLAPTCVNESTNRRYPSLIWKNGWKRVSTDRPVTFVDAVLSSGSLVCSEAVERAGPPRADFFIDFVDLEHCLRLRANGYRIAVVRDSIMHHAVGSPRTVRFGAFSYVWSDHVPWREYYKTRNEVFTIWTHYPTLAAKLSVVRRLLRHALGVLLFGKERLACLKMMYLGVIDGRAGKLGIRSFDDSTTAPAEPEKIHA